MSSISEQANYAHVLFYFSCVITYLREKYFLKVQENYFKTCGSFCNVSYM